MLLGLEFEMQGYQDILKNCFACAYTMREMIRYTFFNLSRSIAQSMWFLFVNGEARSLLVIFMNFGQTLGFSGESSPLPYLIQYPNRREGGC